ncbi:serine/arginine repetitive matrix protein 1-like [Drosophila simulans]|uniref:serine/arginine repetitive matrix protein 1-like n=1 Tax=Drosophila simulans TaxID=7240 RepID=UPI001D101213|nr:serine/arginine repetitive matrix protein 1-like [Drosophila simulans]
MTATQSPPPTPPRMTPAPAQAPLPTPPRPTRTPSKPPPQPRTPTPPPQQRECPRYDRQQAWEIPQAHVGQVVRTIEMGGRLWHQQSVTWTWPASMETEDAPEARVWEEAEAIGWRTPDQESRDPRLRARAEGKRPEKEVPREESPGEANPEKREWSWPAPGEAPPPPRLPRQTSCPEARQPPLQAGVAGRPEVEGGANERLAAPGGRGSGWTRSTEAKSALGQVIRAWRAALPP